MANKGRLRDVKPQLLRIQVVESAANTFTEASLNTPVVPENGYVMEILKIYWELEGVITVASEDGYYLCAYDRTRTDLAHLNDQGVIWVRRAVYGFTTSGAGERVYSGEGDFTDGAGNGLLYARREIFLGIQGASQGNPLTFNFAVLYRLVEVTPEEIIGLVAD